MRNGRVSVEAFLLFEFACQLALAFTTLSTARLVVRIAAFAASLAMLAGTRRTRRAHPAQGPALWVILIVVLSILNPSTNGWLAGTAQASLYIAILGPLFWVPRLRVDVATLRRAMFIVWTFQTVSAAAGVLQFYFPGHLQPNLSSAVASVGADYVKSLHLAAPDGRWVIRPMGLSDVPGGAAIAGFYAVLFGIGFFVNRQSWWIRLASAASVSLGICCIYLSQIRSVLVVLVVSVIVFGGVLARRGRRMHAIALCAVLIGLVVGGFHYAVSVGGTDIISRVTAITDHPGDIYLQERGHFLVETIQDTLPTYPLGAGLGRWGMVNHYFGDNTRSENAPLWVEIQWTGWILDGGLPLVLAYVIALAVTVWTTLKIASRNDRDGLWLWAAMLFGYDIGAIANTFAYPVFIGQSGLEFWLFNALLYSASNEQGRRLDSIRRRRL
ncbi:MAG: hypothetical protein ABSD31_09415 [Candidatus Binataceae bacterium]